jgi:hypothetical protein
MAREKVIASAANAIEPTLAAMLNSHAEAICTENAT